MCQFSESNTKIARFDIAKNYAMIMNVFNNGNNLINQHKDCLKRKWVNVKK